MKISPLRIAFSAVASLAMATSANAAAILQFSQQNPTRTPVVATTSGSTTTLSTTGDGATGAIPPGWVPVFATILDAPVSQPLFMSFTVTPTATGGATQSGTAINQGGYTGTIVFSRTASLPVANSPANVLTITFSGGLFSGTAGGNSASLSASSPPSTVNFSSGDAQVQAALLGAGGANFSLGFSGLTAPLAIANGTIAPFNASVSGSFSTVAVPEPASLVMASIPALLGLGFVGFRRRSMAS